MKLLTKLLAFLIFGKGGWNIMAMVYVTLLINSKIEYSAIPVVIRPQVNQILIDLELEYLIPQE